MSEPAEKPAPAPQILWRPSKDGTSHLERFIDFVSARTGEAYEDYSAIHRWSIEHNDAFWDALWDFAGVIGDKGTQVRQSIDHVPWTRFFPDSKISYAENMLARAATNPGDPAIIYRLQGDEDRILSWHALYEQVSIWEQALAREGLGEGDRIGVYLSNVPETVIILLAASNLGITFVSAGMEMGPDDLINRFGQVQPKLLITTDSYTHGKKQISRLDTIERAQAEIPSLQKTILLNIPDEEDNLAPQGLHYVKYNDFLEGLKPQTITFNRRDFNHPLYILFSSGSTGKPKCFEHSTGGVFIKHIAEYLLQCDVKEGDRVFYHATPSWMMWNWLASGLAVGATILMYDGSPAYPDAYAQWDFTSAHGCSHHGTAAPVILSWEGGDVKPAEKYDLSALRMVMSTGAVLPAQGFAYIHDHVKEDVKISSITGGTDLVGVFAGGNPLMEEYAGQINGPFMGLDIQIWDDDAKPVQPGEAGELVCANAFPSMPLRFLDDEDGTRYKGEYFEHYDPAALEGGKPVWRHGDSIELSHEGQFIVIGRSDATLNQNGVRIGSVVIYDQLSPFADQLEGFAAVDFTRPDNKQAITVLFLVLKDGGEEVPEDLAAGIKKAVKDNVTPYAIPTEIIAVPGVLKTPNGKIAEVVMKKILAGKSIPNGTLYGEDLVAVFEKISQDLLAKYG